MQINYIRELTNNIKDIDMLKSLTKYLASLSNSDVKKIMIKLKDCNYNTYAYIIAIDSNILNEITIDEQLKLIESQNNLKQNQAITFSEYISNITNVEELEEMLDNLEKIQEDMDIKLEDDIAKYVLNK